MRPLNGEPSNVFNQESSKGFSIILLDDLDFDGVNIKLTKLNRLIKNSTKLMTAYDTLILIHF